MQGVFTAAVVDRLVRKLTDVHLLKLKVDPTGMVAVSFLSGGTRYIVVINDTEEWLQVARFESGVPRVGAACDEIGKILTGHYRDDEGNLHPLLKMGAYRGVSRFVATRRKCCELSEGLPACGPPLSAVANVPLTVYERQEQCEADVAMAILKGESAFLLD